MNLLVQRPIFNLREVDLLKPIVFMQTFFNNHKGRLKPPERSRKPKKSTTPKGN